MSLFEVLINSSIKIARTKYKGYSPLKRNMHDFVGVACVSLPILKNKNNNNNKNLWQGACNIFQKKEIH